MTRPACGGVDGWGFRTSVALRGPPRPPCELFRNDQPLVPFRYHTYLRPVAIAEPLVHTENAEDHGEPRSRCLDYRASIRPSVLARS